MKKLFALSMTAMLLVIIAVAAHATVQVTTQTPDIFYAGTRERPSGIGWNVQDTNDFPVAVPGFPAPTYYYGYVRLLRNATLAINIGNINVATTYDPVTKTINNLNLSTFETITVGANPATTHLDVTGSVLTNGVATPGFFSFDQAARQFGILGVRGADFFIVRIPVPASNQLSQATPPMQILIRNLCVNMATSTGPAYGPNEFLACITAHSNPDVLLNKYPDTATRNNDIANYNPIPYNIAFTGQGTNFNLREVPCPKNFVCAFTSPACAVSGSAVDPIAQFGGIPLCVLDTQAPCPYFRKCFVIDRVETTGDITLNNNRLTINPSDYVYPQCLSIYYTLTDSDAATYSPVSQNAQGFVNGRVYDCREVANPLDFSMFETFTTPVGAKRLAVCLIYTIYQPGLQLNQALSLSVSLETDIDTECGGQTGALNVALGNTVACNSGSKTIYFPYVIIKKADWVTGIAITNLTPAAVPAAQMSVVYTLYDKNGVANTVTKTGLPSTTYEFIVDSWIVDTFGQAVFDALPAESAGWLNVKANFSVDGFIFYTDGNFGAGSWPRP